MASRLNPYIGFRDNARQAFEFYRDVFGGDLVLSTFGDMGDADAPGADKIMHAMLETDRGFTLMGADTPEGMPYEGGSAI
jgi:PhnB protein